MTAPTLPDFLLARYAEDEAVAKAALGEPSYPHYGDTAAEESWAMAKSEGCAPEGYRFHRMFDPARVLADVEAKRRIVGEHRPWDLDSAVACCQVCYDGDNSTSDYPVYPCPTLRFLALPYADHPDYREEWRP